jgi:hypothetical protein
MRWMTLACCLSGCVLDAELCGQGFESADGRCVPARPAPAWYGDGGFDAAPLPPDARPWDAQLEEDAFQQPPDASAPNRWEGHKTLLVVDRGARSGARRTPETPGFDLDAVGFYSPDGRPIGRLSQIIMAQINDPFAASRATQPDRALGEPDASDTTDGRRFVSLGTEGGYLFASIDLQRTLQVGDRVVAFEVAGDVGDELAEIYLCQDEVLSLDRCHSLGSVQGTAELRVPD